MKQEMEEETTERKTSDEEAQRTLYDVAYWKRAMKTGCMIMVQMSVVSMIGIDRAHHIIVLATYLII